MQKYLEKLYKKSKEEYYTEVDKWLKKKSKKFILTVNPEMLMLSKTDKELEEALNSKYASLIPDGIAVVKACKWFKCPVNERITGVDLAKHLLDVANECKYSLYLFGAKKEVIDILVKKINKEYSNINLVGYSDGYVSNKDKVMEDIIKLKPDICMVALGIPYQEKIIYKYIDKFDKGIFVGVGGSFDVLSGVKQRAPRIFIKLNLEWLYRIVCEPKRLKRFYDSNIKFIIEVRKECKNK